MISMVSIWASATTSEFALSDPATSSRPRRAQSKLRPPWLFGALKILALAALLLPPSLRADVLLAPEAFIAEQFPEQTPAPKALWLTGKLGEQVSAILGHRPASLRARYWAQGSRSAWILEEIGKELPITVGISVQDGALHQVRVLIYRESRGWEVRLPSFTEQFEQLQLDQDLQLNGNIDGISGATLSVRALSKLARLALLLDSQRPQ